MTETLVQKIVTPLGGKAEKAAIIYTTGLITVTDSS